MAFVLKTVDIVCVQLLNEVFSAFDELANYHKIEKIKTIGEDALVNNL